jgi:hypothetical protein
MVCGLGRAKRPHRHGRPHGDRVTYQFFDCSQVRTRLGDFLVVAFGTPEEGEFVTRHTVVFKGGTGTWTRLYEDSDLGHDLLVDIWSLTTRVPPSASCASPSGRS